MNLVCGERTAYEQGHASTPLCGGGIVASIPARGELHHESGGQGTVDVCRREQPPSGRERDLGGWRRVHGPREIALRQQMAAWITELNPHREIRPVLTNLKDVDPSFLRNVLREGVVLHGSLVVTREGLGLQPRVLLAYDLSGAAGAEKARISRMLHGYETHVRLGHTQRTYRNPGLKEGEGNALVTRSALLLRKEDADAFAARLRARRIPFTRWDVYAQGQAKRFCKAGHFITGRTRWTSTNSEFSCSALCRS